jgi:hypothetical protein
VIAKFKMGEGTQGETSIKVVLFSGKMADWTTWEENYLARAKRREYKDILLGKIKIPTEKCWRIITKSRNRYPKKKYEDINMLWI